MRCCSPPPLYNFGVSQHFKTWVDMVVTDPRMAAGTQPILAGKPAVLVTVRGGNYRAGTPREGWDHATGWMRRILADVWNLDLRVLRHPLDLGRPRSHLKHDTPHLPDRYIPVTWPAQPGC